MKYPILLLHGALGSSAQLEPIKSLLESRGFEVHLLNFSGHSGEPFEESFGIEVFSENILQFLDRNGLATVDIFGYSMGGYVALWFAHHFPKRVNTIITLGTKFDWSEDAAAKEVRKLDPNKILEKVPAFARILEHRHAPNDWKILIARTADMMLQLGRSPLLTPSLLAQIRHEVFILLGDQDDMADRNYSKDVSSFLPNGKFQLLENTPHPIEKVNLEKLVSLWV